jgi:beta-1,4-mannooligosaccharide/beta-1,4-mannosyl-N-acetylglucosamine phosphorylase
MGNILKSASVIKRHPGNPVLSDKDVPYPAALVFNAGITKFNGQYVMLFRNDYGSLEKQKLEGTNIGLAYSSDGIKWKVAPKPCFKLEDKEIFRAYDPRLTVIDGKCYMCFAVDTKHGLRGGIALTEDFDKFEILSLTVPDNRNMVLFPRKIGGKYGTSIAGLQPRWTRPFRHLDVGFAGHEILG